MLCSWYIVTSRLRCFTTIFIRRDILYWNLSSWWTNYNFLPKYSNWRQNIPYNDQIFSWLQSPGPLRHGSNAAPTQVAVSKLKFSYQAKQIILHLKQIILHIINLHKLVREMKQMIERNPSKHYFIRQRKICSVDKNLSS